MSGVPFPVRVVDAGFVLGANLFRSRIVALVTPYELYFLPNRACKCIGTDMYEDSWFQLEGAAWRPFRHPIDAVRHGFNFMQYKLRQFQVSYDRGVDARTVLRPAESSDTAIGSTALGYTDGCIQSTRYWSISWLLEGVNTAVKLLCEIDSTMPRVGEQRPSYRIPCLAPPCISMCCT